jgi:hypothetical protein
MMRELNGGEIERVGNLKEGNQKRMELEGGKIKRRGKSKGGTLKGYTSLKF